MIDLGEIYAVAPFADYPKTGAFYAGEGRDFVVWPMILLALDLRAVQGGVVMRSALNHAQLMMIAHGAEAFHLLVYRSMARTAWHELRQALLIA